MTPSDRLEFIRLQRLIYQQENIIASRFTKRLAKRSATSRLRITQNALTALAAQNNFNVRWESRTIAKLINNQTGEELEVYDL